jgi:hypothetical protein
MTPDVLFEKLRGRNVSEFPLLELTLKPSTNDPPVIRFGRLEGMSLRPTQNLWETCIKLPNGGRIMDTLFYNEDCIEIIPEIKRVSIGVSVNDYKRWLGRPSTKVSDELVLKKEIFGEKNFNRYCALVERGVVVAMVMDSNPGHWKILEKTSW